MAVNYTGTNPYELMERSLAGQNKVTTFTNPYDLMERSLAGRNENVAGTTVTPTPDATSPSDVTDPNQDLYNQLLGMSSQRILTDTLANLNQQQQTTSRTYSQMYQDLLRNQRMQRGLSDTSGFTGGMAEQYGEKLGATQLAALGQVGIGREAAIRDIQTQRRMAPYEALSQAVEYSQAASAMNPLLQQAEVYAAAGDTANWANIMNQVYGTTLQYDPETGGFVQGGQLPETMPKTPTAAPIDLSSPTLLPRDREQVVRDALSEAFVSPLTRAETNRFIEKYGIKENYDEEVAKINQYEQGELGFDEWSKINQDIFGGRGTEAEYLRGSGGAIARTEGEDRIYFRDSNNEFLQYLVENYRDRFGQDLTPRTTGPSGNYIRMTVEEAAKAYEDFIKNR